MTEGRSVFRETIDKCTIESFQRVMRDLRDCYPGGWPSCESKQLQLVEMPSATDRATWYIKVPNDDYKREGWACIEARRHAGEQIQVEIRDDCRASEDRGSIGRVSLREFAALVVSEAAGSMFPEERPETSAREQDGLVGTPETEKTFFLDTSADLFAQWLADYTGTLPNRDFPTERGRITLQSAKPPYRITGPTRIDLDGTYIVPSSEGREKGMPVWRCISFKVVPLARERTEVIARCHRPEVVDYFRELLGAMKRRWPQPLDWMPRLIRHGVPGTSQTGMRPAIVRVETPARISRSEEAPTPSGTERWSAMMRGGMEYQVEVKRSLKDLRDFLENQKRHFEETGARIMMAGPFDESGGINCVLKHVPDVAKRIPNELCTGSIRAIEVTGGRGARLTFRLADFPDSDVFWQTARTLLVKLGAPTPPEASVGDIVPAELDPTGGKYGTCRDLTIEDVRVVVARCRAFQGRGGKVPEFYRQLNITPGGPRSFELGTLRGWLKDPKFAPKNT